MSIRIINGKVYKNGTFSEEDLVLKEGKISSAEDENADEVYDAKGKYVVPGFIDVHTHVGQCNIVSLQEGQTRIVILKIQGGTHSRRHLIDEAENAVVAAGTVLIHELVLECDADFLVILFFDFQVPFLAVLFPDREFQIRVVGLEVVIEDVLDDFPVHAEQFISRFEFQFFGNTARFYCLDNMFRLVFHRSYVLAFPFTSL